LDAVETAPPNPFAGDLGKPAFDRLSKELLVGVK
jgi:hypothetical protein